MTVNILPLQGPPKFTQIGILWKYAIWQPGCGRKKTQRTRQYVAATSRLRQIFGIIWYF
jgi:hypothetical protein